MKRWLKYIIIIALCGLVLYVGIVLMNTVSFVSTMGECGMSAGPCYGEKTTINLDKMRMDEYLDCPNGKIGFMHTKDKAHPVMFKIGLDSKIKWAYMFDADACCGIPMLKISGMELETRKGENSIRFFNDSYSEPGVFYLTKDFDFDFLCLSPM